VNYQFCVFFNVDSAPCFYQQHTHSRAAIMKSCSLRNIEAGAFAKAKAGAVFAKIHIAAVVDKAVVIFHHYIHKTKTHICPVIIQIDVVAKNGITQNQTTAKRNKRLKMYRSFKFKINIKGMLHIFVGLRIKIIIGYIICSGINSVVQKQIGKLPTLRIEIIII
jgi:hypothetical protein